MYSQWSKNIPWKIIDNVPFLSTKLSKYRVTCAKLAGELANRFKLEPIISDLSQDLLKRVFSHHRHDIDKVMAQCLLAENYPSWSHQQYHSGVGPLKIEMDPLKLLFYTLKGSRRPLLFWRPVLTLLDNPRLPEGEGCFFFFFPGRWNTCFCHQMAAANSGIILCRHFSEKKIDHPTLG